MRSRWRLWITRLFSSEGFRGPVLTLLSGSSVALVVGYLARIVIARLCVPEEVGLAAYYRGLLLVLVTFSSLRSDDALLLPEDDKEAAGILSVSFLILLGFTALFSLALLWRDEI